MIEFKFNCPACGQHIMANDAYTGRQINCPTCQSILMVPQAPGAPPPVPTSAVPPPPPARSAPAAPVAQRPAPAMQRPAPAAKKPTNKWLLIGVGAASFLIAGGITFALVSGVFSHSDSTTPTTSSNSRSVNASANGSDRRSAERKDSADSADANASGLSAADIVQKVGDAYAALTSYSAEGVGVSEIDMSKVDAKSIPGMDQVPGGAARSKEFKEQMSKPIKTESNFSVKLARPNLYLVEWETKVGPTVGMKGATWSAGDGDFLMMSKDKYVKMDSREMTLASATGVSGGVAGTMPTIFFGDQTGVLSSFKTAKLGKNQSIDGDDCYVLKGNVMGMQMTLWVAKDTFLIKQKQMVFGGKTATPDLSDAQIDEQLNKMGNMTAEQKKQAKAAAKQVKPMMAQMKGKMTETYNNIITNKSLNKTDFKYEVPPGATLAKSLF